MVRTISCVLVFLLVTASCLDEPDCYSLNNDLIVVSFKKLEDSTADTVEITALGTLEPPLIFSAYSDTALSKVVLPLNYFEDETTFYFEDPDTIRFLHLGYISQAQFVSVDCGEKFVLSALKVLEHNFDSVRVLSDAPATQANSSHLEIYQ
jgi:hypothetical protein